MNLREKQLSLMIFCFGIFTFNSLSTLANDCKPSKDDTLRAAVLLKQLKEGDITSKTTALEEINSREWGCPLGMDIVNEILRSAERKRAKNDFVRKGEFGLEYDSQLLIALGNTRDSRAIPYLIDDVGDPRARESLYKIGEAAIDPLIKKLHDESVGHRSLAARALGLFLKPDTPSVAKAEIRERIKEELIKELRNPRNNGPDRNVEWYETKAAAYASARKNIIAALGHLAETGDRDVIPIIESIAEKDPYYLDMSKKKNYTGPKKRYTVREEATKILERLKGKESTK